MHIDDALADTLTEADAHLIAAAPDLLAACKAILAVSEKRRDVDDATWDAIQSVRAAIAKAEGGPS